jgi:peptidoglycan lytic transglycosylase G
LLRRLLIATCLIATAMLAIAAGAAVHFMHGPLAIPAGGLEFEIAPGTSFRSVSNELADLGAIRHPVLLRAYARWTGQASAIQAGDYLIAAGTTPIGLLQQFTSGAVRLYPFTIVEGWNRWELLEALHDHPYIDASLTDEDWPALLESLGAATSHPEGLFLPETYHFPRGTSDRAVLAQAYALMQEVLHEEWQRRAEDLPIATPYEALTLASIVEKETARPDERPRIAGVFVRRLDRHMRLQTDPTVIYGIGAGFNGNLTRHDLATDTPYNTYTRHGLPPTPIALPGRAALHAALHPAGGDELYFVATGLGDGSHTFSATKEEHDAAVADYLKRLREQRRRQGS